MSVALRWVTLLLLCAAGCSGQSPEQPATPTAAVSADHGRDLFRNKGCVTCHHHARVEGETGIFDIGPDLTAYRNDAEFLRQWLADPKAIKPDTPMPDIDLSAAEVDDLIAFLNDG